MSKAQVETILGQPTSAETKDMLIFKKTTYRYEDGKKFAMVTFKNDEVDSNDTNLDASCRLERFHFDEEAPEIVALADSAGGCGPGLAAPAMESA